MIATQLILYYLCIWIWQSRELEITSTGEVEFDQKSRVPPISLIEKEFQFAPSTNCNFTTMAIADHNRKIRFNFQNNRNVYMHLTLQQKMIDLVLKTAKFFDAAFIKKNLVHCAHGVCTINVSDRRIK